MRKLLPLLLVVCLLCGCVQTTPEATNTVTVEAVHEDGRVLLKQTQVPLPDDATVFDALTIAAKEHKVPVAFSGEKPNRYVEGIGGLFSFAEGELSGWLYYVNDESPSVGADQYQIQDGDTYRFLFVTDFTKL